MPHTRVETIYVVDESIEGAEPELVELRRTINDTSTIGGIGEHVGLPEYRYNGASCQRDGDYLVVFGKAGKRLKILSHPD